MFRSRHTAMSTIPATSQHHPKMYFYVTARNTGGHTRNSSQGLKGLESCYQSPVMGINRKAFDALSEILGLQSDSRH